MILIMRGLPGSGKSTWIEENVQERKEIFSADHFHMVNGQYKFDPKLANYAHNECLKRFTIAIMSGKNREYLIIDNTNTTLVELAPYVRLAQAFGIEYEIIYVMSDLLVAHNRGVHNVPLNTMVTMQRNLINEIVPLYWKQRIIS